MPITDARALDPELRRAHAFDIAWHALRRRDRTEAELRRALAAKRVAPELIDEVLAELAEQGYVDDAGYARRFAEDRRRLDGWGPERIERRLRAAGVAHEHIHDALGARAPEDDLEAAVTLLARRFPSPPTSAADLDRAVGVLLRKGYGLELAHDALRRFTEEPLGE